MKFAAFFLALFAIAVAQDLAPASVANHVANFSVTGNVSASFTSLLTPTQSFRLSGTGIPLTQPMTYTWTRTGANTATLVETDGARTNTTALTFTSPLSGTFRTTSSATTNALTGEVMFSPIPQQSPPLLNISTRTVLPAGQVLNPGFVVGGTIRRRVLVRAVGPTLGTAFGVPGSMANPSLTVFRGQTQIAENDDWGGGVELSSAFNAVGAFALPVASLDAALLLTLDPGNYTAQVRGTGAGDVIVEVYFVD